MRFISLLVILACALAFALASPSTHGMLGRNAQEAREAAEAGAKAPSPPWKREAEAASAWKREAEPASAWKREAEPASAWKREAEAASAWKREAEAASAWKREAEAASAWKREPNPPGWKRGGESKREAEAYGAPWKRNNKNRAIVP